ncbi:MAG: Flp pilus assembly protein CpaB, partial [Rhodovarius sp.]|nr:Flp pilus assembly protein CpaB [Rhodovarius sp.]
HRAISVAVDIVTGTAGLIWPGDLVDLILTQERPEEGVPFSRRTWAETVERRLRVIAVDQRIAQGGDPAVRLEPARAITLEVTPEAAERIAVASRLGRLSLVVRPQEDDPPAAPAALADRPATVFARDVSPALARDPAEGQRVRVIQGAEQREVTFR